MDFNKSLDPIETNTLRSRPLKFFLFLRRLCRSNTLRRRIRSSEYKEKSSFVDIIKRILLSLRRSYMYYVAPFRSFRKASKLFFFFFHSFSFSFIFLLFLPSERNKMNRSLVGISAFREGEENFRFLIKIVFDVVR